MAMSKFNKNCVISGSLDYYCLVCETYLRSEEQVEHHILKPEHTKAFNQTAYVKEFPSDCIRKVKNGYYCEYCNELLMNAISVRVHVAHDRHVLNSTDEPDQETTKHFRRVANAIIALNDVLIDDQAWNAFISDCCLLCDIEFSDGGDLHKNETKHILNVIQSKIKMDVESNLFRKINTPTLNQHFQCLTCNEILPEKSYSDHFSSLDHKKKRLQCRKAKRAMLSTMSATNKEKKEINKTEQPKLEATVKDIEKPNEDIKKLNIEISIKNNNMNEHSNIGECSNKCQENASVGKVNKIEKSPKVQNKSVISDSAINDRLESKQQGKSANNATAECSNKSKENASANKVNKIKEPPKEQMKDVIIEPDINERLGIKDYIYHVPNGDTAMCLLCEWGMPVHSIGSHVNEDHHQTMSKLQKEWFEKKKNEKNYKVHSADKIEAAPNNKNVKVTSKVENTSYNKSINKSEVNNEQNYKLKVQEEYIQNEIKEVEIVESKNKASEIDNQSESTIDNNKVSNTVLEVKNTDSIEKVHEHKVSKITNETSEKTNEMNDNKSKIFLSYNYFKKNGIKIDFILDTAICRKCSEPIDFNCSKINKHIVLHKKGKSKPVIVNACDTNNNQSNDSTFSETKNEKELVANSSMSETKNEHDPENYIRPTSELASEKKLEEELPSSEIEQPDSVNTESNKNESIHDKSDYKNEVRECDSVEIKDTESAEQFARNNNIEYNMSYKKSFCRVCEMFIPTTLSNLKEHVNGEKHSQAMQRKASHSKRLVNEASCSNDSNGPPVPQNQDVRVAKAHYKSKRTNDFIRYATTVETIFSHDVVINDEICVEVLSFMMMKLMGRHEVRCQVCELNFPIGQVNDHKLTVKHLLAMRETPVIVSLNEEFVRVLRPNYFHCGFCNFVEFGWDSLQNHLKSEIHRQKKTSAQWLLRDHIPDIRRHRANKELMCLMALIHMMNFE